MVVSESQVLETGKTDYMISKWLDSSLFKIVILSQQEIIYHGN